MKISFPNTISVEQWRASIGLWGTPVKRGQKKKNPESLKQKYFSQTSPIQSTWFADVNNCPKLLRLKSLSMVGQMIVFFCVVVFLWTPNMYCSIHRNKHQVFMGGQQFSNEVPLTLNFNSQSMAFYIKQFSHPYFSGSRIELKENNVFATTQYTGGTCHAVVINLRQTKVNENYELRSEGKSLLLQDLGIFKTIYESVIKFKLLAISMNVERNPGPEFTKVICGSFSQGNNPKFGNMAGKQCCAL